MKPAIDGEKSFSFSLEDLAEEFAEFLSDQEQPVVRSLSDAARQIYDGLLPRVAVELGLGRAASVELDERLRKGLRYTDAKNKVRGLPEPDAARALEGRARAELQRFTRDFTAESLAKERADDRARDALSGDRGLVEYLERWRGRLAQLQATWPEKWKVPALTEEELRDELEVRLLEQLRAAQAVDARFLENYEAPGKEATFRFLGREKDALRKRRAMYLVPRKLRARRQEVATVPIRRGSDGLKARIETEMTERVRNPEEQLARLEVAARSAALVQNAGARLSAIQRKWFAAMRASFASGERDRLNLQAVAEDVGDGKARSTASRMRKVLRDRLEEIGAAELVGD